jgi:NAD(P)-dependent dehydrogenase (short-subunit alcohol dehydrogenase family)
MPVQTTKPPVAITGSGTGIGHAMARAFAEAGHPIAIIDIDGGKAEHAAAAVADETGVETIGIRADVADSASNEDAHRAIEAAFGTIGVLINNAGIMQQKKGWIEELPEADFDRMLDIHVRGSVVWSRLVLPAMRAAGFGRIINMSSANALLAVPHRLAYVTAKKAILGLTEGLALDCARAGITVNAILPGYILTETLAARARQGVLNKDDYGERTPVGRWGTPEEIARVALFLADPASSFITGSKFVIDGGLTIRGDPGENIDMSPFV